MTDQLGTTDTASTTVTVTASNQPPVAGDDQVDITEDTTVTIDVLANDTDADDGTLSVQSVTGAAAGDHRHQPRRHRELRPERQRVRHGHVQLHE